MREIVGTTTSDNLAIPEALSDEQAEALLNPAIPLPDLHGMMQHLINEWGLRGLVLEAIGAIPASERLKFLSVIVRDVDSPNLDSGPVE